MEQTRKCSVAFNIAPQVSGSTTPIALPASGILNIATDDHATAWTIGNRIGHANGQFTWQTAGELYRIDHFVAICILASIGGIEYFLIIGRPTQHPTVTRIVGETAGGLA